MDPAKTPVAPLHPLRLAGPDHLRALAIILVFFWHYRQHGSPAWVDAIGRFGWTGVDLFFVLSGYLIGGQLMKKMASGIPISFSDFYVRRFFRIIPAYLVVLGLYCTIPAFSERNVIPPVWKFLTFTQNLGLDFTVAGGFSHAWSLCIEEQFYLLLPVILMILVATRSARYGLAVIFTLFIAGFAIRWYSWEHFITPLFTSGDTDRLGPMYFKWLYYPTWNRIDGLLAGVSVAALYHFRPLLWARITKHGNALLLTGLILLTGGYFATRELISFGAAVFGFPLVSVAYGFIVLAALSPTCVLYRYPLRISSIIATLAYTIYLTHKQLNHLVRQALAQYQFADDSVALFLICIVVAVIGGIVLHLAVERPFLILRDRYIGKAKPIRAGKQVGER